MELFNKIKQCIDYAEDQNVTSNGEILPNISKEDFSKMQEFLTLLHTQLESFKE